MRPYAARKWLIHTALTYLGKPYRWSGDDPSGFDCSGFVIECLKTIGTINESEDYTAGQLYLYLSNQKRATTLSAPATGALLFYRNKAGIYHVTLCLDEFYQIGASGGDSTVTEAKSAWNKNAYIKIRPIRFNTQYQSILLPKQLR